MENTTIEWATHTFNPWIGCTKVAAGCAHCYAEAFAKRYGKATWGPLGTRVRTSGSYWKQPAKWNRLSEKEGVRVRVFCASMADIFEDWPGSMVDGSSMDQVRVDLFSLIDDTPWLDWLLLTKRPESILPIWPLTLNQQEALSTCEHHGLDGSPRRDNVWLGCSIAEQKDADANVPELLKCRDLSQVLFLSCEPLVGPVVLPPDFLALGRSAWCIVGGESGHGARPMHPDWIRGIRDQCVAARVPFFFKQWGAWVPDLRGSKGNPAWVMYPDGRMVGDEFSTEDARNLRLRENGAAWVTRVGKKAAGRILDGRTWDEMPEVGGV